MIEMFPSHVVTSNLPSPGRLHHAEELPRCIVHGHREALLRSRWGPNWKGV